MGNNRCYLTGIQVSAACFGGFVVFPSEVGHSKLV